MIGRDVGAKTTSGQDIFTAVRVIDDLETLRLLTQPVRLRIVEALRSAPGPLAVKELAGVLKTSQTKLYYHINLLEEAGLIRVAATRLVSGITEKRYEAATYRIGVDRALLARGASGDDGLEVLLSVILDQVRTEIRRSVAAGLIDLDLAAIDDMGPKHLVLGRKWLRMTPAEVAAFSAEMDAVWERFSKNAPDPDSALRTPSEHASSNSEGDLYEMLIGFYPTLGPVAAHPVDDAVDPDLEETA